MQPMTEQRDIIRVVKNTMAKMAKQIKKTRQSNNAMVAAKVTTPFKFEIYREDMPQHTEKSCNINTVIGNVRIKPVGSCQPSKPNSSRNNGNHTLKGI